MNKVFFICSLLFFTTTHSQVTISTIKNPSTGFSSNLVFPYIKSANSKTAKTINTYLQAKMLEEHCFPHHSLPYETDLDITIPVKQLEKYLTDYGKKLLL